jgi:predicted dehydrogenase
MEMEEKISRRTLIGGSAVFGAGWLASGVHAESLTPARKKKVQANDKIVIGLIGAGGMGQHNTNVASTKPEIQVGAICDVDDAHLAEPVKRSTQKYGRAPKTFKDFRQLLEMKDIDAVIIGTPDHWHALPCIYACEAGKDVYCEKPISHNIVEGQAMVGAARKFKRIVQVGTWQRSQQHFLDAVDYVRSGRLGKISVCRAWTVGHGGQGKESAQSPPSTVDYDFWVGPAKYEPYQKNRFHGSFRWFYNYAGGLVGDWGVHMIDTVLLGMSRGIDLRMPDSVQSVGGKIVCGPEDDRTTPDTLITTFQFNKPDGTPDFVANWEHHVGNPGLDGGGHHGAEFIGERGRVMVDRGGWNIWDKDGKPLEKIASSTRVTDGNDLSAHMRDWIECIKSRGVPRSDIASMYQTTTVCHLANVAYLTGERIAWSKEKDTIIGSRKARECLAYQRSYRKPWKLPLHRA